LKKSRRLRLLIVVPPEFILVYLPAVAIVDRHSIHSSTNP
jgi:hypothetical protein